jgi:hypothetical protein
VSELDPPWSTSRTGFLEDTRFLLSKLGTLQSRPCELIFDALGLPIV